MSYCSTTLAEYCNSSASCFTMIGLLPVSCRCSIAARTISSLMSSKSICLLLPLRSPCDDAGGDGGGVCSNTLIVVACRFGGGDIDVEDLVSLSCVLCRFRCDGYSVSGLIEGVLEPALRAACETGTLIPIDDNDKLLRRVL